MGRKRGTEEQRKEVVRAGAGYTGSTVPIVRGTQHTGSVIAHTHTQHIHTPFVLMQRQRQHKECTTNRVY